MQGPIVALALLLTASLPPRVRVVEPILQEGEGKSIPTVEARAALGAGQLERARALVRRDLPAALERLAQAEGSARVEALETCARLGRFAYLAEELRLAERAQRAVLTALESEGTPDEVGLAEARWQLATTLFALRDPAGALPLLEAVVEHRERSLPGDHPDVSTARNNLGAVLFALGDPVRARVHFEAVANAYERSLQADAPDLVGARLNLAAATFQTGDVQGARALLEAVVASYERTLPAEHLDLARARVNLAVILKRMGERRSALALEELAHEAFEGSLRDDHPELLVVRENLALSLAALGDLQSARALQESVLEVLERALPDDHPEVLRLRLNLGATLFALGDLHRARELLEAVLEARRRTLPADHQDIQSARQGLANVLRTLGDARGARALDEAVLEARERSLPPDSIELCMARESLALSLLDLGEHDAALALARAALEGYERSLPQDDQHVLRARGNLAIALYLGGRAEEAHALEREQLEIYERTLPPDHPALQGARANLAATLAKLGEFEEARALSERTLETFERILPEDHPDLASARRNLLQLLLEEHLRRSPQTPASERAPEPQAPDDERRERCVDLARELARSQLAATRLALRSASVREAEERAAALATSLSFVLSLGRGLGTFAPSPELSELGFALSESSRAAGLASARLARASAGRPGFEESRRELCAASAELAELAQRGASREELNRARERREAAERAMSRSASEAGGAAFAELEVEAPALAARLGAEDALLCFRRVDLLRPGQCGSCVHLHALPEASLVAFVLRAGAERPTLRTLGPAVVLEERVSAWRATIAADAERGLAARSASAGSEQEGRELRRALLDPLLPDLEGARRLVLCLDDVLHLVPFDALPLDEADRCVGDRWEVQTRVAAWELLLDRSRKEHAEVLVAIGGASFNARPLGPGEEELALLESTGEAPELAPEAIALPGFLRGGAWERGFSPLPYTASEARGVAELFAEVREGGGRTLVLEKGRASRESLEACAPRARWLHVATHGWFAPESVRSWTDAPPGSTPSADGLRTSRPELVRGMSPMLLCGLALAGANLPEQSSGRLPGLLTAEELSTLDLTGCELAVLSACDTNVGERRAGQGVASLQKALHMAGARSVVTSLWRVPDEATRELMLDFYRRLWVEGKPKSVALWEAKRRLRDATDAQGRALHGVRDWAAWVLTGEPD